MAAWTSPRLANRTPRRSLPCAIVQGDTSAPATVLALLYFGRDVLVPVTLAVILSLLIAPLVRVLRSVGMGQTLSVLAAVLGLALAVGAAAAVLGGAGVKMTASLPQDEQPIRHK